MIIPAVLAFGLTLVRELIKDISDIEGDSKVNLKTFPIVAGVKNAWTLASAFSIIIGIGAVIPYIIGVYNYLYLIFVIIGVEIPLALTVFLTMKSSTITTAKQVAKLLKFSTIAGVMAVWLGSINGI